MAKRWPNLCGLLRISEQDPIFYDDYIMKELHNVLLNTVFLPTFFEIIEISLDTTLHFQALQLNDKTYSILEPSPF